MPDLILQNGKGKRKFVLIDIADTGELVPAVTGKAIRVISIVAVAEGSVKVRFRSGAAGDYLTGQMSCAATGGVVFPENGGGWFQTTSGEALYIDLTASISVDGVLVYEEA